MSFWQRLKRVVKSQANAALEKLESPEQELELLQEELEEEKRRSRRQVADALVEVKRLEKEVQKAQELSEQWEQKAIRAVELGDDELARQALLKKSTCDQQLAEQQFGLEEQQAALTQLKQHQRLLEERIEAAQRKRKVLQARVQGAKVKESIGHTMSTMDPDSPLAEFERMNQEVEKLEAKVEMNKELYSEIAANDMEQKLRDLESKQNLQDAQEDPLAALKAKMQKKQKEEP